MNRLILFLSLLLSIHVWASGPLMQGLQKHRSFLVLLSSKSFEQDLLHEPGVLGVKPIAPNSLIVKVVTVNDSQMYKRLSGKSYISNVIDSELGITILENKDVQHFNLQQSILVSSEVQPLSIQPGRDLQISGDPLVGYQWGLYADGQRIYNDKDDIHYEELIAMNDADIGSKGQAQNDLRMKKDIVVAVLDSGIDLSHPDLVNNIYRNDKECVRGKIPRGKAKKDNDGNGYKGDCMGWNFTAREKKVLRHNRPLDDMGHGTHVAGIVAAESNNGIGISSLSNRIKVMPLKVTFRGDNKKSSSDRKSLLERVIAALEYSIKMKVDVVVMSLGWPATVDAPVLRETFQKALKENITIVIAAGNNEITTPLFPCAYKGVFCVGATRADGKMADFTNYGGHVDLLAPGDNILSTFPTSSQLVEFSFDVAGYDIKSGTSQSAPLVAAMVSVLKGIYPNITNDELYARLMLVAKKPHAKKKYSLAGLVHLEDSIAVKEQPAIFPVFKSMVQYAYSANKVSIPVEIKNYWKKSDQLTVMVKSLSKGVSVTNSKFVLPSLNQGESVTQNIRFRINNVNIDNELDYEVSIKDSKGKIQKFRNSVVIVKKFDAKKSLVKTFKVDGLKNGVALKTLESHPRGSGGLSYYTSDVVLVDNSDSDKALRKSGLYFDLYNFSKNSIVRQHSLFVANAVRMLNVWKMDLNSDGREDILLRTVVEKKQEGKESFYQLEYRYLTADLKPLYDDGSVFKVAEEGIYLNNEEYSFVSMNTRLGNVLVPVYLQASVVPNENPRQMKDKAFQARKNGISRRHLRNFKKINGAKRVIYLEPIFKDGEWIMYPSLYDDFVFQEKLRKKMQLPFYAQVRPLGIVPKSRANGFAKTVDIIFAAGSETEQRYFTVNLNEARLKQSILSYDPIDVGYLNLQHYKRTPLTVVDGNNVNFQGGMSFVSFFNPTLGHQFNIEAKNFVEVQSDYRIEQDDPKDHFTSFLHTFLQDGVMHSFYQSRAKIMYFKGKNGQVSKQGRPLVLSRFLPGKVFSYLYYPVVKSTRKGKVPSLFVDATQMNTRAMFLWTLNKNRFSSPISSSWQVPENCVVRNPVELVAGEEFNFVMQCRDDNDRGGYIHYLPIK